MVVHRKSRVAEKIYICEYALDFIVGLRLTKTNKQEKENKIINFSPNLNFEL